MIDTRIFEMSDDLAAKLAAVFLVPLQDSSNRLRSSSLACSISLEHANGVRLLVAEGLFTSALVVHRAQYEAAVRAVWILHSASDAHIEKLSSALTPEAEQGAKNLPLVNDMVASLPGKAPAVAYQVLSNFKSSSCAALNSYVHAGIHPLKRHDAGYPTKLIEQVVKNSNGLAIVAGMQAAVLTGHQRLVHEVGKLQMEFKEYLPDL
jgi:hypothetical protein